MIKPVKILFISCALLLSTMSLIAQNIRYGLEFSSFEVVQEKRTGLILFPSNDFSFSNSISLSFDLFFHPSPEYHFGYIFRIIGQNNLHIDFLVNTEKLTVVDTEDNILAECMLLEASDNFSSFIPFQLSTDVKNNLLKITIGEKEFSQNVPSLKYFKNANIIFGKCDHPSFQSSDVPKMIIRDIRINNIKQNAIYHWKLSKHVENGVYDELKNHFAKVENPRWLLDDHAFWNKKISFTTLKNPQITYNQNENVIAVADIRNFYIYNPVSNNLIKNANSSGFVHSNSPNQMIYNTTDSTYYSYCFNVTDPSDMIPYNFALKSWNNNKRELGIEYWHHNRYVSQEDNSLYLFGGYGQHKYKNQVNKYSFDKKEWEILQYVNEQIKPRYLSGLGVIDEDSLLLFGGYGNSSGYQFLSPRNFYDLYRISLPDLSVKKIWEMETPNEQFVVANSMVVDTLNKCFYALCFPQNQYETSFYLAKFSMIKPEYEIVSNKIPCYFNDVLSYVDLFHNKNTEELYVISFSSLTTDSLATVSIYSLRYPPLSSNTSVYQHISSDHNSKIIIFVIIALFAIFLFFVFILIRKKFLRSKTVPGQAKEYADDEFIIAKSIGERNEKQAIFLFGGFQVKDKNSKDITGEFSPMLKQLFLIILLNTIKDDGKGISSVELDDTLWPNKSHDSARNNRSVMTSRLRQLFENVGSFNIESFNSYWIVKLGDEIYCDYREALSLLRKMKKKNSRTKEDVMKLLNIVSYGEMLPNLQIEWVDSFKANFANQLIDLLLEVSRQKELAFSPVELIYLADTLLIYDILNDDALKLKCCALIKMGKNGLAMETYNSFVKQYSILFGSKYNYSFVQVIS